MCVRQAGGAILETPRNRPNGAQAGHQEWRARAWMARCSGTKNEPFIPSLDGAGLSLEFRVVRSLFEYRKQTHRQTGYSAPGAGPDCALLCALGKVARVAHGSLS